MPSSKTYSTMKNKTGQKGNLVVESICQKSPTEGTAVRQKPCVDFRQNLPALVQIRANIKKKKGTRVEVTGASFLLQIQSVPFIASARGYCCPAAFLFLSAAGCR